MALLHRMFMLYTIQMYSIIQGCIHCDFEELCTGGCRLLYNVSHETL